MKRILVLLICISSFSIVAQQEANNWYFGRNAGITFNTNPPSSVSDGQLNTNEGCSSISDVNGNLLMYTDGRTIWNRNHEIMSNANYFGGTGLQGDPSSTSSGLIVPHPTNTNLYYVFTVDEPHHDNANAYPNQGPADADGNPIPFYTDILFHSVPFDDDGFNNGLNYSIVDMTLNGGLGDVIQGERNNELITYDPNDPEEIKYKASEKITAVSGRDCNSVWLITHFQDKYYAFFIDENGIDETPVISTVEPLIETSNYRRAALGYLKASPKANKLLVAHITTNYNPQDGNQDAGDGNVYAYDFNNLTGAVTNPVKLIDNVNAYGVEFSQDGTKVYATVNNPFPTIYQWNLSALDIPGSIVNIITFFAIESSGALQLAPDGKIYHSKLNSTILGVINQPNAIGEAVNYSLDPNEGAIPLISGITSFGLPPFIQSLFQKRIPIIESPDEEIIEQVEVCDTYTFQLGYDDITDATYTWFKEGEVLPDETENTLTISQDPAANFPIQENYKLEVDLNDGSCPLIGIAKITFNQSPPFQDDELKACKEEGNDAVFDLTEIRSKLENQTGVNQTDFEFEIFKNITDAETGNNPIEVSPNFVNNEDLASLTVKIFTNEICELYVDFKLTSASFPDIDLTPETLNYCPENFPETISINALRDTEDNSLYDYVWSTGETTPSIEVNSIGNYSVDISFKGENCFVTKAFQVEESQPTFSSERIELCDVFQYTITQDEFSEGSFTWYENGNLIPNETDSSLNISISENLNFPITSIYRLEVDLEDGSCVNTFEFDITFYKIPDYSDVVLETCNDVEPNYGTFNLENSISDLLEGVNGMSASDISVEFYETRSNALQRENEIQNIQNFENVSNLNRIFAIVESFDTCSTLVEIELFTFRFQNANPEKEFITYCQEDFPEPISLNALETESNSNSYNFLWSTSETSQTIGVNQSGVYSVEVSDPNLGCSFVKEFEVITSNLASFEVNIESFNNLNTLTVILDASSLGDYEFAMNSLTNFQDSNIFENLSPGIYRVYVRDKFGCGISQKTIEALGFMEFFTPNGDGVNDVWKILGVINFNQDDIQVYIFDRYGKLLKMFTNRDFTWDGTYNGKNMPTDDYWYRVRLPDGSLKTGNFTLKR